MATQTVKSSNIKYSWVMLSIDGNAEQRDVQQTSVYVITVTQ